MKFILHTKYQILNTVFKSRKRRLIALGTLVLFLAGLVYASLVLRRDTEASWWNGDSTGPWQKRQKLTIVNSNTTESLAVGTTIAVTVNTKTLVSQGKLQDDCDDLRILYQDGSTTTVLDRYISYPGGTTCGTSEASKVYFKIYSNALDAAETDTNYYMYYGNPQATSPSNPDNAFDIGAKDALLVCPFDGTTTCAAGETPSTSPTANRYPGSKSALSFDGGSNDHVDITSGPNITSGSFTIETWFTFQDPENNYNNLFSAYGTTYSFYFTTYNGWYNLWLNGTKVLEDSIAISPSTWYHLAVTFDATDSKYRLYLNGNLLKTSNTSTSPLESTNWILSSDGGGSLHGKLDEFRVSNVVRYTQNFTPSTSPLIRDEYTKLLLHFDENGDDPRNTGKAIDDSGNGNHGTITGAKYVAGLVGIDASTADTGKAEGGNTYAGHEGIFMEEGTTNQITNPSFEHSTYNTNWTAGANITATENTTAPYYKFGSKSAKLVASADETFTTITNPLNTNMHTLSAFVYDGTSGNIGGTIDSSIAQMVYDGNVVTPTTYKDMGGGWWRMDYSKEPGNFESYNDSNYDTDQGLFTTSSNKYLAQGFQVSSNSQISGILLYLKRTTGTPTTTHMKLEIQTDASGVPSGTAITNGISDCAHVETYLTPGGTYFNKQFIFSSNPQLSASTQYHLVLIPYSDPCTTIQASANGTQYFNWGYDNSSSSYANGDRATYDGSSWTTVSGTDHIFQIQRLYSVSNNVWGEDNWGLYSNSSYRNLAQGFKVSSNVNAYGARLYMSRNGTGALTTTYFQIEIQTDNSGVPSGTAITNGVSECRETPSNLTSSVSTYISFKFPTNPSLTSDTQYHLVLKPYVDSNCSTAQTSADGSNYMIWRYDGSPEYPDGTSSYYSTSWTSYASADFKFFVDFSGLTGNYGVQVKSGKTVYLDGVQLEEKYFPTSYVDGSLNSGYYWTRDCYDYIGGNQGPANNSCSIRPAVARGMNQSRYNNLTYSASEFNKDAYTISFWMKPKLDFRRFDIDYGWNRANPLVTLYGDNSNYFMLFVYGDTDRDNIVNLSTQMVSGGGSNPQSGSYQISTDWTDQWKHIVWTFDITGNHTLYIDNSQIFSYSNSGKTTLLTLNNMYLGYGYSYGSPNSVISDFRVYNDDLTSTEVADLYYSGLVSHSDNYEVDAFSDDKGQDAVGLWHFDEAYGTTAHDSSKYGNDLTVSGASWHSTSPAPNALTLRHLHYDGSNDYAYQNWDREFDFGTGGFTLQGWFQHPSTISGIDTLLARYSTAGWKVYMNSSGYICFGVDDDNSWGPDYSACSTTSYADSKWHHFDAVKDTSTITLYIDGNQVAQTGSVTQGSLSSSAKLYIGIDSDGTSNPWDADIDEVSIYPYAKTATQIKSDLSSSPIAQMFGMSLTGLEQGLVGYWKMDESDWTNDCSTDSALDSSGNGNHGDSCPSVTGPDPTAGKFGKGGSFDGMDDYVSVPDSDSLDLTNTLTISAWIKPDIPQNDYDKIVDKGYATTYSFGIGTGSGRDLSFWANGTSVIDTDEVLTDSIWQHVVVTYNGSVAIIYLNGSIVSSSPFSGTIGTNALSLTIGAIRSGSSTFFDGSIDELRMYNRALSPSEVEDLYNWAPGPVGYWKLDENSGTTAYDSSGTGNNSSSFTGNPAWTSGKFGSGLSFPGGNSTGVVINDSASLHLTDFTLETWVKTNVTNVSQALITKRNAFSTMDWQFFLGSNGMINMSLGEGAGAEYPISSCAYTAGSWTHLAVTKNGSSYILYKNGVRCDSGTSTVTWTESENVRLGVSGDGGSLNGILDEAKVYNYARTPSQIIEDMNAGHPAPGSPVGSATLWWKFDEGYGTTANDTGSSGNYDASIDSAAWLSAGKFGKAANISAISQKINAGDVGFTDSLTQMTISMWLNPQTLTTARCMISKAEFGTDSVFTFRTDTTNNDEVRMYVASSAIDVSNYYSTNNLDLTTSSWQHLTLVYDGTAAAANRVKVYKNGILKTGTVTGTIPTSLRANASALIMGESVGASCSGLLSYYDEVKIYSSALTADQVKQEFNQGKMAVFGATSTDSSGNPSWSSTNEYCPPGQGSACTVPVAEWKLDEKTGTSVNDTSGNGNVGTISGAAWTRGKIGQALNFNGNSDSVQINSAFTALDGKAAMTVSAWVKPAFASNAGSRPSRVVINRGGWTSPMIRFADDGGQYFIECDMYNSSGTGFNANTAFDGTPNWSANTWHHVLCRYTGNELELYWDNQLIATDDTATGTIHNTSGNMSIGSNGVAQYFSGIIDDIKIYDYSRTLAQIAWEYNQGGPIGWWKLDDCTGTTANDSSGNSITGTLTMDLIGNTSAGTCSSGSGTEAWNNGTTGKRNASFDLDGSNDYIDLGTNSKLDIFGANQDFSIAMWIKRDSATATTDMLFSHGTGSINGLLFEIPPANPDALGFISVNNSITITSNDAVVGTTGWQHVALTADRDGSLTFYVNGRNAGGGSIASVASENWNRTAGVYKIGRDRSGLDEFTGLIDDVRIYNYTLTAQQLKDVYNEGAVHFGP